jgi:hypothetical protein
MPYVNRTPFFRICTNCGKERWTTYQQHHSGLCRPCSISQRQQGSKRPRHFLPGALYPEEAIARFWKKVDKDTPCLCHSLEDRCWLWTARIDKKSGYACFSYDGSPISAHRFAYQAEHGPLPQGVYVLHMPPCLLKHCVRHLYAGTAQQNTTDAKNMNRFPTGEKHAEAHRYYADRPRGDEHWSHKNPELLPHGDDHWTHRKPELVARGDKHAKNHRGYSGLPRGEAHAQRHQGYGNLPRGEHHHNARMTEADIHAIRAAHAAGMSIYAIGKQYQCARTTIKGIVRHRTWRHIP